MMAFSNVCERVAPSWMTEVLEESAAARRVHRWWQWAVLSLGCVSGCASWEQIADNATQPLRTTGNLLAQTGDRIGDVFESGRTRHRNPANLPAHQGLTPRLAQQTPAGPKPPATAGTAQAGASSLATSSQPAARQAIHNTPAAAKKPSESLSVPTAPPAVELLPAPPATLQPISHSRPALAADTSAITTWCRVRVRNISPQALPQVAVTVNSPENAKLASKDGNVVSAPVAEKMEFAPVPQVAPNEEIILVIGVAPNEQKTHRLRVQVRDGLGGSNQDVQARWNVTIEALK